MSRADGIRSRKEQLRLVHQTLRVAPAMAAGISDHVWSIEEIVDLLDTTSPKISAFAARPMT